MDKTKPPSQKEKGESRHLSKFPGRDQPSIFDVKELNYRVRKGNGWDLNAIDTDKENKEQRNRMLKSKNKKWKEKWSTD